MPPDPDAPDRVTETRATDAVSAATEPVVVGTPVGLDQVPAPASWARYELGASLGKGGMGDVMLAHDAQIGRDVAVKRARDQASRARFLREARIQGRLDHPAIVPVHELGADETGRPFFVMKRIAGVTLREVLTRRAAGDPDARARFPLQRLLRAFTDICLATEFAHTRGVVHRDLKPENIMFGDFGEVWLLDWGVARVVGDDDPTPELGSSPPADGGTVEGTLLGTPGYIAPEQMRGDPTVDRRADIFSLGAILFEILAGAPLLPRRRDLTMYAAFDARPSARAPDAEIAPELDALCVAATAVDRDARPGSARVVGEQVQRYLDGDRDVSLRRRLAADHLVAARGALVRADTTEGRRVAMSEAGRALALDPASAEAGELVGRLVLEPPARIPPEIEREVDQDDDGTTLTQHRLALLAFAVYLAFVPVLAWLGATWPYLVAIGAMSIAAGLLAVQGLRHGPEPSFMHTAASLTLNTALIAVIARICTPFLVAPTLAAATTLAFGVNPREGRTWVLNACMIGAVLGPWLLERAGVLSRTMRAAGNALVLESPVLHVELDQTEIALALSVVAIILVIGSSVRHLANAQRVARRSQQLQAWHLRQLVKLDR